jgi:hypothetical protein
MVKNAMNTLFATSEALGREEQGVLAHVESFGLTVIEAARRLPVFLETGEAAAERAIERLERAGYLASTWLYRDRRCYYRPPVGQSSPAHSISEETKIRRFARLSFCCLGKTQRMSASPSQLRQVIPDFSEALCANGYYLQADSQPVLGFLRIDMAGSGRWDRVLAKCCEDARHHARTPSFQQLIEAGQFEITLVTALPQKAERLCQALTSLDSLPAIPIRVTSIPELVNLIAPPPD